MDCPICEKPMIVKVVEGVEIDHCRFCNGVWLDEGELENLSGLRPERSRQLICMECDEPMATKIINNVEIDYCQKCKAVWLDKGELEKLAGVSPDADGHSPLYMFVQKEILSK